jgi:Flp pilus assembly pilin Flp
VRALHRAVISESGATAIEYSLAACFIALAVVVGAAFTGNGLNNMFYTVGTAMQNATSIARGDGT